MEDGTIYYKLKTRSPAQCDDYAMCFDPGTVLFVTAAGTEITLGTAAIAAGTAIAAVGAVSSGIAARRQADFQATIERQRAERERQIGAAKEDDFRRRQSRLAGARRAALGATGVDPGEGSPLMVSEDIAGEVELQALRLRSGGETRATRLEQQSVLTGFTGRARQRAGFIRGGATLLRGFDKAFG